MSIQVPLMILSNFAVWHNRLAPGSILMGPLVCGQPRLPKNNISPKGWNRQIRGRLMDTRLSIPRMTVESFCANIERRWWPLCKQPGPIFSMEKTETACCIHLICLAGPEPLSCGPHSGFWAGPVLPSWLMDCVTGQHNSQSN